MFQNDRGDDHFCLDFKKNRQQVKQFTTKINN